MILSIIISTTLKKEKKYPENNRIFVQMTIKQSLMILITTTTFVFLVF